MMKRVAIEGVTVEVDEARTAALYDESEWPIDGCECDYCTNARMARREATPPEQAEVLRTLGLDPAKPYHSASLPSHSRRLKRYATRRSYWPVYGRILDAEKTPRRRFDHDNSLEVFSHRQDFFEVVDKLDETAVDEPDLICVVATNRLLVLYNEVCGFRQDYVAQRCPDCGSRWRQTGYLKRRSLIPAWKGLPHLDAVLRKRQARVYVEFCVRCGRMEHRIVEDRPPFRRKNTLYEDELKAMRTAGWPRYHLYYYFDETMSAEPGDGIL
ncbi:MAG: hypothetical protein ACO1SV_20765 [Fimbriimonas sp.]